MKSSTKIWPDVVIRLLMMMLVSVLIGRTLYFFVCQMMLHALSPDFAWLLLTGNFIIHKHSLPAHDLYSWTYPQRAWVVYQWLFEVAVASVHSLVGLLGVVRIFIFFVFLVYLLGPIAIGRIRRVPLIWCLPIAVLVLELISNEMQIRPMAVTVLFLWVQYEAVSMYRESRLGVRGLLMGLVPVYVLWGNCHMGVSLGLLSLLLFAVGDQLERRGYMPFLPMGRTHGWPRPARVYAALIAIFFTASLLNPYGFGIYVYLIDLSARGNMNNGIPELSSPNFHDPIMLLALGLMVIFCMLLPQRRRVLSAIELLHLTVFSLMTLVISRFVVEFGLFCVLILPMALHRRFELLRDPPKNFWVVRDGIERHRGVLCAVLFVSGIGLCAAAPNMQPLKMGACSTLRPGIVAYFQLRQASNRLFTSGQGGSCMLFYSHQTPVFVDTRFDFYPQSMFTGVSRVLMLRSGWRRFLKRWKINTFLVSKAWPFGSLLLADPHYRVLYQDKWVVLAQRVNSNP